MDTQKPKRSAIGWCFFILAGLSALTGLTAALVTIVLGQAALCRVGGPVLEATGWQDGLTHCAEVIAADGKTEQMLAEQAKLIVQMSAKLDELANKDKPRARQRHRRQNKQSAATKLSPIWLKTPHRKLRTLPRPSPQAISNALPGC